MSPQSGQIVFKVFTLLADLTQFDKSSSYPKIEIETLIAKE